MISGVAAPSPLEPVERRAALLVERHEDEGRARQSRGRGIEQHDVAGDQPALLQQADAAQTGRRREVNPFGEIGVGQPAVAHQGAQDRPVAVVDFLYSHKIARFAHFAHSLRSSNRFGSKIVGHFVRM